MRSLIAILIPLVAAMATLVSASHLGRDAVEPPTWEAAAEPAARLAAASWQCLPPPPDCPGLDALDMVSSTFGVAIHQTAIYTYRDGEWDGIVSPLAAEGPPDEWTDIYDVDMLSASDGWIVGDHGAMLHYVDGEWQIAPSPTNGGIGAISMVSADEGWAVANSPTVFLHYVDGSWQVVESPSPEPLRLIDMVSANDGWAATTEGTFLHYDGTRWQVFSKPVTAAIDDLDMASSTSGWATTFTKILHYDGTSWQVEHEITDYDYIGAVGAASDTEAWVQKNHWTLLHRENGVWQEVHHNCCRHDESTLSDIQMLSPDEGWAVGQCAFTGPGGWVMRYTTGSATHEERRLYLPGVGNIGR